MNHSLSRPALLSLTLCMAACSAESGGADETNAATGGGIGATGGAGGSASGGSFASGGQSAAGGTGAGTGGTGTGGSMSTSCAPNPSGGFVVDGDVVVDEITCLMWQKGSITSEEAKEAVEDPYPGATKEDASAACDALTLGGYDDWRAPSLGELASIATLCKQWGEPTIPWSAEFDATGALWTTTDAGGKNCVLDATAGGTPNNSYSSGPGVRCVRGTGTVTEITECAESAIPSCN